ncbi:hypothetical protein RW115_11960 [Macrococcus capreoli]
MERKILILISIILGVTLIVGNYLRLTEINNLENENKNLTKMIKSYEKDSKESVRKNTSIENTDVTKLSENDNTFKVFNEKFISSLNITTDVESNNKFLKSISKDQAQEFLSTNHYILEQNTGASSQDIDKEPEAYKIEDVKIETKNIESYFNHINDNTIKATTIYQVHSQFEKRSTTDNYIAKADYEYQDGKWKVAKIYSIAKVEDNNANKLYEGGE